MVFNLWRFDPDKPWEFTEKGSKEARRFTRQVSKKMPGGMYDVSIKTATKRLKKKEKKSLSWLGWRRATAIAKALEGSIGIIPARPFAGLSEDNLAQIERIAHFEVQKFFAKKGGEFTFPIS